MKLLIYLMSDNCNTEGITYDKKQQDNDYWEQGNVPCKGTC